MYAIRSYYALPDAWAIDQLFPIMPVHRLNERPTRQAILSDIFTPIPGMGVEVDFRPGPVISYNFV